MMGFRSNMPDLGAAVAAFSWREMVVIRLD